MSKVYNDMVQILHKSERAENLNKRIEMLKDAESKIFYALSGTEFFGGEEYKQVSDWLRGQQRRWQDESFNLRFEASELIKEYRNEAE